MIKRALIYVENTENILDLAKYLDSENWTIFSAGRTEDLLRKNKINVKYESALDESIKYTNDFALLTKQIAETIVDVEDELLKARAPQDYGYSLICINTRPSLEIGISENQYKTYTKAKNFYLSAILRLAFSNYENVLILTDPQDYKEAIVQLKVNDISNEFRTYLAAKALNLVSAYDAGISATLLRSKNIDQKFLNYMTIPFIKESSVIQGVNPQQQACLYKYPYDIGASSGLSKIPSKDLSYNLVSDVSKAWELISTLYTNLKNQYTVQSINKDGYKFTTQFTPLTGTVFTIAIKFGLIIGAALSTNVLDSFKNTYTYDKEYITDVVLGCSAVIDESAAREIVKGSFIAIIAPSFTPEAKEILEESKKIRLVPTSKVNLTEKDGKIINGGILVQTTDKTLFECWHVRTNNRPTQQITDEMAFGMLLALKAHSYSAILIKKNHIVGIAQSCTSCEKAISEALAQAKITEETYKEENEEKYESIADILVCGSPITFTDSVKKLIDSGLYGIIQTGGTNTDEEFIKYCDERGLVMVFTNMTHYNY